MGDMHNFSLEKDLQSEMQEFDSMYMSSQIPVGNLISVEKQPSFQHLNSFQNADGSQFDLFDQKISLEKFDLKESDSTVSKDESSHNVTCS